MKKNNFKVIIFYVILFALIIFMVTRMFGSTASEKKTYSEVIGYFYNNEVSEFSVDEDSNVITLILNDESKTQVSYKLSNDGMELLLSKVIPDTVIDNENSSVTKWELVPATEFPWWLGLLPYLIIIVVIIIFYVYMSRQISGKGGKINSFGKIRNKAVTPDEKHRVMFKDVAGADEEKAELEEIVEFLKNPSKYTALGAKIPHGVLLVGPPGTGKTLLAKAVAGEAGVPFLSISGSDFVEMYVGVGASRVRDLFETARKAPASIVFIDEIDAVGRHRGAGLGGGHDEREQTLNQLLVEMDGFSVHDGIIVIAATNRPDILDPALLRPGRFDRQITVSYPDIKGREEILKVHARNKPLENAVDFKKVAQSTVGFTGADLANLLNEAALLAARRNKSLIGMAEIEDSYMKILLGPQKKGKVRSEHDNKLCAYHEAGHAVSAYYCKTSDPVTHITIIPAGRTGGVTMRVPVQDSMGASRNQMYENIIVGLGGRVAEALIMDDISTGASSDIQNITSIARNMVTKYGMSEKLGPVLYGSEHSSDEVFLGRDFSSGDNLSEKTMAEIDDEIRNIIDKAYKQCEEYLKDHIDKLHLVAGYLLHNESMDGDQFKAAMESDSITYEELDAILEEKKLKSQQENEEKNREAEKAESEKAAHNSDTDNSDADTDADTDTADNDIDSDPD